MERGAERDRRVIAEAADQRQAARKAAWDAEPDEPDAPSLPEQQAAPPPQHKPCPLARFSLGDAAGAPISMQTCKFYTFGVYCNWTTCKYRRGHVCFFCRSKGWTGWGHQAACCQKGGAQAVAAMKLSMAPGEFESLAKERLARR
jgi:hypothetical protein